METEAILRVPTRNINLKYHHLGIPTKNKLKDERHLEHLKMYVSGYGKIHMELNGLGLKRMRHIQS